MVSTPQVEPGAPNRWKNVRQQAEDKAAKMIRVAEAQTALDAVDLDQQNEIQPEQEPEQEPDQSCEPEPDTEEPVRGQTQSEVDAPAAQPRPVVDAAIVRSDAARLTTVVQRKPSAAAQRLAAHARHHSAAHMAAMRRQLQQGASFEAAHAQAMASVGR